MLNITKFFPGVEALNDVSIVANSGEIMGLVGVNGAGKSTLMNVLGGIYPSDSGKIILIKPNSTIFKGNLSMIIFSLFLLCKFICSK